MWSSSPFNSQRSVFSTAPRHKQSFGPSPLPSFYGAAEGRRNDQVVAQYASARLVNSVFARARTQHLPAAQRPIRHPGEARSPYHAADRVVAGSGADDTSTPRMAPRAQIQTSLTPPHYTPPTALAARAVGMDDARVQGLQVRNRLRDDERRRRKIRKQREVMAEHTRRVREALEKREALEREKRRRPAALGPGRHPKQAARLYSVLKRRVQHSDDENMYWGASLAPTSSTSAQKKKKNLKVTFCPDETLAKDEEGAWVPHRQTNRAEYEERWFPGPGPDDYRRHKERRYARAKVLLQERVRRVQRNGGYENDYGLQQERIRSEIMIGHEGEDEDDSERESDQGGEEEGEEYGGNRRREEEVVLLGMHGVDSEGAR